MEYKVPFLPASKRFFKISELAGKRWPNVTEDQIYEWHDINFQVPVKLEIGGSTIKMADTTIVHLWKDPIHGGTVNIMAYWMFFQDFQAFRDGPNEKMDPMLKPLVDEHPQLFNVDHLFSSYLMIDTKSTTGFAFNKAGKVNCLCFYDERGILRIPAQLKSQKVGWCPEVIEVCKEDLLIRASSVQLLEAIAPEITRQDCQVRGSAPFNAPMEKAVVESLPENEDTLPLPPGAKILEGWKDIAKYLGCSIQAAQRHCRPAVKQKNHSRKVITTTAALDEHRLKSATKKKRK